MPLCTPDLIVNANRYEGEISALRCKRWSCPICREDNRRKVMHAARRGEPNIFLTLTVKPDLYDTPDEAARDMKRGLVALRRRIERKWGIEKLPFIVVFERTKKGWPHMHLLCRAPFMPQKELAEMWQAITGAFIIDIRFIRRKSQVLFYVTKYIGKDLAAFEGCKRWWRSHNYQRIKDEKPLLHLYGGRLIRKMADIYKLRWDMQAFPMDVEWLKDGKLYFKWRADAAEHWKDNPPWVLQ